MATDYPSFFPCPNWEYGEQTNAFAQRTAFTCGWTRQRQKYPDDYRQLGLTFVMNTATFARWSDWANASGYDWFRIELDTFASEKQVNTIRFITPLAYQYDEFDIVTVTVDAETSIRKDDPPKFPDAPNAGGPTNDPCGEYVCDAMSAAQQFEENAVEGSGAWDLLDANDGGPIPEPLDGTLTYGGLKTDETGSSWTSGNVQRVDLIEEDMDLCGNPPYAMKMLYNTSGQPDLTWVDPPFWGTSIPNASVAVVIHGFRRQLEQANFIFRGGLGFKFYGQGGNITNSGINNNICLMRTSNAQGNWDSVVFNYGTDRRSTAKFEVDTFSNSPCLLQASIECTDLEYIASSTQSYTYAAYDIMGTFNYSATARPRDGVGGGSFGVTVVKKLGQIFDKTKSNANDGPIDEFYLPWNDADINTNYFMSGGFSKIYNLSIGLSADGGDRVEDPEKKLAPALAPGAQTDFAVSFDRNFSDYVKPPECP